MELKSQELISDSYPHSHKADSVRGEGLKIYIFLNLMLNLKNNENDAVSIRWNLQKKKKRRLNEGYFFGQHPLVEKSLTATNIIYINL